MTEAEKPRPFGEHMQRAIEIHDKLKAFAKDARGVPDLTAKLAKLRAGASAGYWLYPIVEARLGIPS